MVVGIASAAFQFGRTRLALLLATTMLAMVSIGAVRSNEAATACPPLKQQVIADAALATYVRAGEAARAAGARGKCAGLGGPPCFDPFPYVSVEELRRRNPDCCRILDEIPDDEPMTWREYIAGRKHPRMYLVAVSFEAFERRRGALSVVPYQHKAILTVDCFGEIRMRYR